MSTRSKIQLAKWLQRNDPYLFRVAVKAAQIEKAQEKGMGNIFSAIGNIDWGSIGSAAVSTVTKVAPALIQYKSQKKILDTNLKRAETGLPPIDYAEYQPTVKIAPEITPETEQVIQRVATQAVSNTGDKLKEMLPYFAAGLGLILILKKR